MDEILIFLFCEQKLLFTYVLVEHSALLSPCQQVCLCVCVSVCVRGRERTPQGRILFISYCLYKDHRLPGFQISTTAGVCGFFLACKDFGERCHDLFLARIFLFFLFLVLLSGDSTFMLDSSTLLARISPQWLSKVK